MRSSDSERKAWDAKMQDRRDAPRNGPAWRLESQFRHDCFRELQGMAEALTYAERGSKLEQDVIKSTLAKIEELALKGNI